MIALAHLDRLFDQSPGESGLRRRAASLSLLWERAAAGHTAMAGGCACGLPAMHVSVADFEQDLLDYLRARWAADSAAVELIEKSNGAIGTLVRRLGEDGVDPRLAGGMLGDLETAIRSFAPAVSPGIAQRAG